ncbi:hypothetical protein [Maribacter dokdonensis]|uniref:hypothetical protein n=1 Tax=Maribacter dokdonensis TaxID=320912 RepID=UPI001C094401|nr:hypothetical protein [Maribacter dokdonensis]MBU2902974.1 hypothetical protein [Maribacter dokdonensis]
MKSKTYINIHTLYFIFIAILLISCTSDDTQITATSSGLDETMNILGGKENLFKHNVLSFHAEGKNFEWEQPKPSKPNPLVGGNFDYNFSSDILNRKVRIDFNHIKYDNPYAYDTYGGKVIINDKKGSMGGEYHWQSFYFGLTDPVAMYASRIEAIIKNQLMANPIALIKKAYELNIAVSSNEIVIPYAYEDLFIKLKVDSDTKLPLSAEILEEDFLNGDVIFKVTYNDWKNIGEVIYPHHLRYYLNGNQIKEETLDNVKFLSEYEENKFTTELVNLDISYDPFLAKHGVYFSQWHHRWLAWGIPIDQRLDNGAIILEEFDLNSFGFTNQSVSPNIKIIGRPDLRTWTVAIEVENGIYVVDAPLNVYWTSSCIDAIKRAFPNKPIIGAITTHTHHVTFGGIRQLLSETDKLFVGRNGMEEAERAINADFTLMPDDFQGLSRSIEIIPVDSITKLNNGEIEVRRLVTADPEGTELSGPHADDMCVIYLPNEKVLIEVDHFWTGEFMNIWDRNTNNTYSEKGRTELQRTGNYLLDYINENELEIKTIIGIHGGVGTMEELKRVCNE